MSQTLGQVAFEAYAKSTDNKTYDGKEIPPFAALSEHVQEAWERAAQAVVESVMQDLANDLNLDAS